MQIFIKTLVGKTILLEVQDSDTVASIKAQIANRENVLPDHQRLIFDGKQLEDEQTVQHYRIRDNSVIHLVVRIVAKQPPSSSSSIPIPSPPNEIVSQSIFTTIYNIVRDLVNGILGYFF